MASIATLDNVSYLYPRSDEPVLRDVSLEIARGEFLGLIGPTGAGKTTLCLTLNGIVPQFYGGRFFGRVTVAGLDSLDHPISTMAQHVGMVFEDPETQITATSVENEIAFGMENLRVPREEIEARIPRILEAVRLTGSEKKRPDELSGGEKQRLAIAAALALQPDLLVLDEPTSQLDPVGSGDIFATLRELNRQLGITIVIASHAAEEMAEYTDRVALLSQGELIRVGSPDDIYGDVDQLLRAGLRPPQVAETFFLLRSVLPVPTIPITLADALPLLDDLPTPTNPREVKPEQPRAETLRRFPDISPGTATPSVDAIHPSNRAADLATVGTASPMPDHRSPSPQSLALSACDLHHVYPDGTHALRGISVDISAGEYVLIAGQNGAGKSTLVKHFLGLLQPTSGQVQVGGIDSRKLSVSDLARTVGYVSQNPDNQIFNATVEEEVAFALKNLGFPKRQVESAVTESLAEMGLLDVRDRHPLALPKGDRARVVIAAVLAMDPQILIFDEPTTGQDDRGAQSILEITRRLHKEGRTVVIITHHLYLMPKYAERMVVMGKGTKLLDAPMRQACHEAKVLASTYLSPPQAVLLAQALDRRKYPEAGQLITPEEVAAYVAGQDRAPTL